MEWVTVWAVPGPGGGLYQNCRHSLSSIVATCPSCGAQHSSAELGGVSCMRGTGVGSQWSAYYHQTHHHQCLTPVG